jgi:predicted secreted hydrolase
VRGRAWLDHEWSDSLLPEDAVGWDWIGMNLDDGSALTTFRLRNAKNQALWAGGSFRPAGGPVQDFAAEAVRFEPLAWWSSAATQARYPVRWRIVTPAGTFEVHALLDAQELDARTSTGSVYWEGLSELRDDGGKRRGWGYLEMTGYAGALRL